MSKLFKSHRVITSALTVLISVFCIALVVYGATTIGTNITTEGYATSTTGLWTQTNLHVGGNTTIDGKATSTTALAVGAGTISTLDMAAGDLFVQDDIEALGFATTTGGLFTQGNINVGGTAKVGGIASSTGEYFYLQQIKLAPSATPTPAAVGKCFINTTAADAEMKCHNGTDWQELW